MLARAAVRAAVFVAFSATALAVDYTPHGTQPGLAFPLTASQTCRSCHRGDETADATNMPYNTWAGSMMANATRDPLFWAALDVANHDGASIGYPGVGDFCLRCHAPRAWYGGRIVKNGAGGTVDGSNGCLLQGNYATATDNGTNDFSGESCHFCHRLVDQGPAAQPKYLQNAAAWLDDVDCGGGEPCRHGPYSYTVGGDEPPHAWAKSAYVTQSENCGLCHNVTTPDTDAGPLRTLRDAVGADTGIPFPVERTYAEWKQSDFGDLIFRDRLGDAYPQPPALAHGRTCQDCHMPNSTDPLARACTYTAGGARTGNLPVHTLVGGNTWVPNILSGEYGTALGRIAEFAQTVTWARAMLQSSATVGVTTTAYVAPTAGSAGSATLAVKVTNLAGHKLPTGYSEGRRAWVNVQVRDNNGQLVFESGAYDAATAALTVDAQAKVYETLHGIWDSGTSSCRTSVGGKPQFHFVLDDCIAKDNRIPPAGFTGGADPETRPVAYGYPTLGGSNPRLVNYDTTNYSFNVPAATPLPLNVTARLYYQTSSREYIEFLRDEAVAAAIPSEQTMCAASRPTPFTVGPQTRTRGQYAYELWSSASYGRSPPETVATTTQAVGP